MAGALAVVLLVAGCSKEEEKPDSNKANPPVEQTKENKEDKENKENKENKEGKKTDNEQNKDSAKKFMEEKVIIDEKFVEQEGVAIGTLLIEKDVSDEDANKLAKRYVDEIKKEYKDQPVNVQVIRDGKDIVIATADKEVGTSNKEEKTPENPSVISFEFDPSFPGFGTGTVIVKLNTANPEAYTLKVDSEVLEYNKGLGVYSGTLPGDKASDHSKADVVVTKK